MKTIHTAKLMLLAAMVSFYTFADSCIQSYADSTYIVYPKLVSNMSQFSIPSERIPGAVPPYDFSTRVDYNTYFSMAGLMDAWYQRVLFANVFGNEQPCAVTNRGRSWFDFNGFQYTRNGQSIYSGGTNGVSLSDEARDFYITPRELLTTSYYDRVQQKWHYVVTGDTWRVLQTYAMTNKASQSRLPGVLTWQLANIYGGQYDFNANDVEDIYDRQNYWKWSNLRHKIRDPQHRRACIDWFDQAEFISLKYREDPLYWRGLEDTYLGVSSSLIPRNSFFPPGASTERTWHQHALDALGYTATNDLMNAWIEMGRFMGWSSYYDYDESILADVVDSAQWWGYDLNNEKYDTYSAIELDQMADLECSWTNYVMNTYGWPVKPEMPSVSTRVDLSPWVWADIFFSMLDTYFIGNGALPQPCFSNEWDSAEKNVDWYVNGGGIVQWHYIASNNTWQAVVTNFQSQLNISAPTSTVEYVAMNDSGTAANYYIYSDKISVPNPTMGYYLYDFSTNYYRIDETVMKSFFKKHNPQPNVPYYPGEITLDYQTRSMVVRFFTDIDRAHASYGSGQNAFNFRDIGTTCTTGNLFSKWSLARQRSKLCPISRVSKQGLSKPSIYPSPALSRRGSQLKNGCISYFESYQSEPTQAVQVPYDYLEPSCTNQMFRCFKMEYMNDEMTIDDAFRQHWLDIIDEITAIQWEKANWSATSSTLCSDEINVVYDEARAIGVLEKMLGAEREPTSMSGSLGYSVPRGTYVVWANADNPLSYTVHSVIPFEADDEYHLNVPCLQVITAMAGTWDDNTSVTNSAVEWCGSAAGMFQWQFDKMAHPEQQSN